jgi:hypothetical protein
MRSTVKRAGFLADISSPAGNVAATVDECLVLDNETVEVALKRIDGGAFSVVLSGDETHGRGD